MGDSYKEFMRRAIEETPVVTSAEMSARNKAAYESDQATKLFCFRDPLPADLADVPNYMDKLRSMLEYDPATGLLSYAFMAPGQRERIATNRTGLNGYGRVSIWKMRTSSANVVWLLHNGKWPQGRLARRDGDPLNDRIENLQDPMSERSLVQAERKRFRGVARLGEHHWQAYVKVNHIQKNLGRFNTEEEAIAARKAWDRGMDLV